MATPVTHFEKYVEGPERLADFYRTLFGWHVENVPGIAYWRVQTEAAPGDGIGGGLTPPPEPRAAGWVHCVHVESLDTAAAAVHRMGGTVIRPKAVVATTAWYTVVADPEDNAVCVALGLQASNLGLPILAEELARRETATGPREGTLGANPCLGR